MVKCKFLCLYFVAYCTAMQGKICFFTVMAWNKNNSFGWNKLLVLTPLHNVPILFVACNNEERINTSAKYPENLPESHQLLLQPFFGGGGLQPKFCLVITILLTTFRDTWTIQQRVEHAEGTWNGVWFPETVFSRAKFGGRDVSRKSYSGHSWHQRAWHCVRHLLVRI